MMTQTMLHNLPAPPLHSEPDDDSLLALMKQGDEDSYRILVERHVDRAYGLALRMLGCSADAEDVAQEALVKAWLGRDKWQPGRAKFSTWLYRVVFNRCIDLRRAKRPDSLDDVDEPQDDAADSVAVIHRRQVYDRLEQAMAGLPAQQRAALTLSYFDNLTNSEIAEIMGASVQAVEGLLKRGRQGLREKLRRAERDIRPLFAEG